MALILDEAVEVQRVLDFITDQGHTLVRRIEVFDVYAGAPIAKGKKSVALRFTYQSFEGSLTDKEVNDIHESVIEKTLSAFNAQLPPK